MIDRVSQHGDFANSGGHPASYSMGTGVKRLERDDRPPPLSAAVKNEWNYILLPLTPSSSTDALTLPFPKYFVDQDSSAGVATYYVADGTGIESRWRG